MLGLTCKENTNSGGKMRLLQWALKSYTLYRLHLIRSIQHVLLLANLSRSSYRNIKETIQTDIHIYPSVSGVLSSMNFHWIKDVDKLKLLSAIWNTQSFPSHCTKVYFKIHPCPLQYKYVPREERKNKEINPNSLTYAKESSRSATNTPQNINTPNIHLLNCKVDTKIRQMNLWALLIELCMKSWFSKILGHKSPLNQTKIYGICLV